MPANDATALSRIACPVCGGRETSVRYRSTLPETGAGSPAYYVPTYNLTGLHREISRCRTCGFAFVSDRIPDGDLRRAYTEMEDPAYLREAGAYRRAADVSLSRLEPYRGPGSRLLEVGCGAGFFLERARALGWDVRGIELSRWMVERARERVPGERVRQGPYASDHFRDIAFDAVVAVDVIEHVPDPAHFLADAALRLRPGGIAYVVTPDMGSLVARALGERWWYVQVPHLSYFSRRSARRLAERCGLETVWQGAYPRFVTAEMVRHRLAALPAWMRGPAGWLTAPLFARSAILRFDLGDQLAMLFRKPA